MAYNEQELQKLLGLQSVVVESIKFGDFLKRLKETPEIGDTAAATLVRAIESRGEVDIKTAPEALRPYLSMLKRMGVPTWKAFSKVKGSQRTVATILNNLRAAAANGYQLRLAYLLKGGPGSGKSLLADAFKDALENEIVYAVKGCPVHENPVNLLNLLDGDQINQIAEMLELTDTHRSSQAKHAGSENRKPSLAGLLSTAGQPCQICWSHIMEGLKEGEQPNLLNVEIQALRLSSRKFGISTWSKDCTLAASLRKGSRGVVDMPEIFGSAAQGSNTADELDLLLEATNDRKIPAGCGNPHASTAAGCDHDDHNHGKLGTTSAQTGGFEPLDCVMFGQTNDGAYDRFIKDQADPNKFTRRLKIINVPYITSVSSEESEYVDFISSMRAKPHFDPMTLKIAALLAVTSRMKKQQEVDIVSRARMYDGEQLVVEKKEPLDAAATLSAMSSPKTSQTKEVRHWSVGQFWQEAGEEEGMFGLNMPTMLNLMSEAVETAMRNPAGHQCVSTLEMLRFLRRRIFEMQKTPGLTNKEEEVLKNCLEYLQPPTSVAGSAGLIEEEYRRVLRRQFLQVMAPDFERRANQLFEMYRSHARAFSSGEKKCVEIVEQAGKQVERLVDVSPDFLNEMENWMTLPSGDERIIFRRSVETQITPFLLAAARNKQESGDEGHRSDKVVLSWRSLPKLARGISDKLNDETAKKLGHLLQSEIDLNDEEKVQRRQLFDRFSQLGYCEHCSMQAIQYFNDYQLWKLS